MSVLWRAGVLEWASDNKRSRARKWVRKKKSEDGRKNGQNADGLESLSMQMGERV